MTPGTSCLATIMLSLWDKIHSPAGALIKLALMGLKRWADSSDPFGAQISGRNPLFPNPDVG
jgi:hypothetical protein